MILDNNINNYYFHLSNKFMQSQCFIKYLTKQTIGIQSLDEHLYSTISKKTKIIFICLFTCFIYILVVSYLR